MHVVCRSCSGPEGRTCNYSRCSSAMWLYWVFARNCRRVLYREKQGEMNCLPSKMEWVCSCMVWRYLVTMCTLTICLRFSLLSVVGCNLSRCWSHVSLVRSSFEHELLRRCISRWPKTRPYRMSDNIGETSIACLANFFLQGRPKTVTVLQKFKAASHPLLFVHATRVINPHSQHWNGRDCVKHFDAILTVSAWLNN